MRALICAAMWVGLSTTTCAADPPAAPTVVDINGKKISGEVLAVSPTELSIGATTRETLSTTDLLRISFPASKSVDVDDDGMILFANGDRLRARASSMTQEYLNVEWGRAVPKGSIRVPLETVRAVAFDVPNASNSRDELAAQLAQRAEKSDVVLLRNGDRAAGEVTAISGTSISLKRPSGETKIERAGMHAILFNSELISFPSVEGERVLLSLADGSQLTVRLVSLADAGRLRVKALFGAELEFPLSLIREARFLGGRAVYLSDLEPESYQFTPYLSTQWPLIRDANVNSGALHVRSVEYPKGLGMHSQSTVVYRLDGKYRSFLAKAGLDDSAGDRGSVIFAVDIDGKRVLTSPVQMSADPALNIGPFDVTGKQRITLSVEFGPSGDIQDHADWCDAVLVK